MISSGYKQKVGRTFFMWLGVIFCFLSCARENSQSFYESQSSWDNSNQDKFQKIEKKLPMVNEAVLQSKSKNSISLFSQSQNMVLNYSTKDIEQPVKLICIPNTLSYLSFVVDNYDLTGYISNNKITIKVPESDLILQCQSKINSKNFNFQVAKLGIRYQAQDYELKNTTIVSNTIKLTRNFIDSMDSSFITNINILCSNKKILKDSNDQTVSFSAKSYFENNNEDSALFINIDKLSIQNQGYKFNDKSFLDCQNNLTGISGTKHFKKIYFVDDTIPMDENHNFLTNSKHTSKNTNDGAYLICNYINELGKMNWHWAFDSFSPLKKTYLSGKWHHGLFETDLNKEDLEKRCTNFSSQYEKGNWKLFGMNGAKYFWSWGSFIQFKNEKIPFEFLPFQKMIVFGDSIADTGSSKQYFGAISSRIPSKPKYPYFSGRYTGGPTLAEALSHIFKRPLINWASANETNSPLSIAINRYINESKIWEGEQDKKEILYLLQMGGNYFSNSQDSYDLVFQNLEKDLESNLNKLIEVGAKNFVIPFIYDPMHIVHSMKQIEPKNQEKAAKKLMDMFNSVITNTKQAHPDIFLIGIHFQNLAQLIKTNTKKGEGFKDLYNPCYNDGFSGLDSSSLFKIDENIDSSPVSNGALCPKQSQYFYFDKIHPGQTANYTMAWFSAQEIINETFLKLKNENLIEQYTANDFYNKVFLKENNPFLNFLLEKK